MIDLKSDELLSLSQLAARLPSTGGGRLNPSSVFRWATKGLRGHKLEVIHVACRMLTTWAAYLEFNSAVSSGRATEPTPAPTPRKQKRFRDAKTVLANAGIG